MSSAAGGGRGGATAETAFGDPPLAAVRLGAQEILEHPGLARHQAVAVIRDGDRYTERRVEVDGLTSNRLLQVVVAQLHGRSVCPPPRKDADADSDHTTL